MSATLSCALAGIAAPLIFVGLAILGFGGARAFFAHPARATVAVITLALSVAGLLSEGNLSAGEQEDRSNRWVILAFALLGLLGAYVPAFTDRRDWWTLDGETVRWLGVALFTAGGALRLWPVFVLGRRFSGLVAIQPGHELVTDGMYGIIRHPSYLGLLVNALGWALAFRSGAGVVLTALMVWPVLARIRAEEALLRAHFGDRYAAYCRRTSRLIPGVY